MEAIINLVIFVSMLAGAYFIGASVEKAHYKQVNEREIELMTLPVVTSENISDEDSIEDAKLVYGSVVISLDYFKRFLAGLRNIFGGNVISYESLLDRGRREAIVRMKERARDAGYTMILNMRFETSSIGQVTAQKGSMGCFEIIAYGTAIKMKITI